MMKALMKQTCLGPITLVEQAGVIVEASFGESFPPKAVMQETPLLKQAFEELDEYLAGKRTAFSVPLSPKGTPFQQRCWQALQEIPYGETRSYSQQAVAAGNPKACRAVGMANHRNPIAIFIPCHRVVGKNGKLVGYGGGLDLKEKLLELEKNRRNDQI